MALRMTGTLSALEPYPHVTPLRLDNALQPDTATTQRRLLG